ncbi:MAG: hypothetical protein AAFX87_19895 [Bacteroidota bacterium]
MSRSKHIKPGSKLLTAGNWKVIGLCLLAAIIFWLFNALNKTHSASIDYPIEFLYDDSDVIVINELPDDIQINVTGLGWNIFRRSFGISVSPINFRLERPVEVKKIPGSSLISDVTDQLSEFQLNYILTDTLYVNIDKKVTRNFTLSVDSSSIDLRDDHRVVSPISIEPQTIELEGPETILTGMSDTLLIKIGEQRLDEDYDEDVVIAVENLRLIKRNPATARVQFQVDQFMQQTQDIPLTFVNYPLDSTASINDSIVSLSYSIRQAWLDSLNIDDFQVMVDFENIDKSDSTLTPVIKTLPNYITDAVLDTARFKVIYEQ